jgi:hypothetical protein
VGKVYWRPVMRMEFLSMPILITKFENHKEIKSKLLNDIEMTSKNSLRDDYQSISNTDWHINSKMDRPYYETIKPIILQTLVHLINDLKLADLGVEYNLTQTNYWFQQYEQGDFHTWHDHVSSFYNNVYYVELPENGAKTTFSILNKEYEFDVKEGDILSFPGTIFHCSKPNMSQSRKTIISFNTDFNKKG